MIKRGIISSFLLIITLATSGQTNTLDSLENLLKNSLQDSNRVIILNELSFKYLAYQPQLSKEHAENALKLARELHFISGEGLALNRLGEYEFRQSNYARAVEYVTQSLKLAEQLKDSSAMANAYRVLGIINTFGFKQYDVALQYQLKAFAIYAQKKDMLNVASYCGNVTWIYAITDQNLKEAHRLADLGIHLSDSLHSDQLLCYNYNSKGLIYMHEGNLDSALLYLERSIQVAKRVHDYAVIAYNKSIEGNIYLMKKNNSRSIELFTTSLIESRKLNLREVLKDSYGGLAKNYEALHNFPLAYRYQILYTHLKDSLVNQEITQRALMAEIEFREAKRESKIAELELANQQARQEKMIYMILFGIGFLFLSTVIILVARNNRIRAKANHLLEEKNVEIADQNVKLKEANSIKDKLFSIIGHDLRSPLVSLKGLLGMVVRNEISDQEFKVFAPKLNQLVMSSNETLENLLQWSHAQMKGWTHTPTAFSLSALVQRVILLFTESAKAKKIELINAIPDEVTIDADENQIELVFRNLIHNAIKYSAEGGVVSVVLKSSDEFHHVDVIDNGVGMSAERAALLFESSTNQTTRGTKGERGTGLGLMLCMEMIQNNGGQLKVTSREGTGSCFHVYLKSSRAAV